MNIKESLPEAFLDRMAELLGTEYDDFLASYEKGRYYGLRRNPLKASEKEFMERIPFRLETVSWAKEGYYYFMPDQPGRHILHEAGAYYIQEPSAMAVVEILDPRPGERILDLCAAPGGKSTQIAGRMNGEGLLVSNEIVQSRAKILSQNIERMGVRNCVVCNETPERMADFFPTFFDRIVVDAPCSGEGMFRKDETAVAEWSEEHVVMCADRQYSILTEAAKMLKPGGVLVYSTCTFAADENEGVISRFLNGHEDFVVEKIPHDAAFAPGRPEWVIEPAEGLSHTMRLMPHKLKGEGHYIARLRRRGMWSADAKDREFKTRENTISGGKPKAQKDVSKSKISSVQNFLTEEIGLSEDWIDRQYGRLETFGEQIYLVPEDMVSMRGMKIVRPGLHLGTEKKNRIEPAHALALALHTEETDRKAELAEEEAGRYLCGESLACETKKGWILLAYKGYPLGFGKAANGQIKNHYPKGLRMTRR
ncbi:MAG: RsmB/NOP family class I SAM-dependent RNA methyltransferase [Lachnospiraceae bacterium]|nr:RsmB/NOP family class I SAM-dependent RNA methyltransferase [Lachnospiraceae bacterium]